MAVTRSMDIADIRLVFFLIILLECSSDLSDAVHSVGYQAEWRPNEDNVKKAIVITDPTKTVESDGWVVGWHLYAARGRRSQRAYLQIWRPSPQSLSFKRKVFTLIGQTEFVALWAAGFFIRLYPEDRIAVKKGDVTGLYFPRYNPVPWSENSCAQGNEHYFKYNPHFMGLKSNKTWYFEKASEDWRPCRKYSYNATVMNAEEISYYDQTWDDATTSDYEKRIYGKYLPTRIPIGAACTKYTPCIWCLALYIPFRMVWPAQT